MLCLNGDRGGSEEEADSGEDDGDGSENRGEEWFVAGEEVESVVAMEVMLPRW
jgi:hypothetical protein